MNLRISKGQLRFRIAREELTELLERGALELALPLASHTCCYRLLLDRLSPPLALREEGDSLTLVIDRPTLENFVGQLPSREGIEHTVKLEDSELLLVFEVDVKRPPRH